MSKLKSSMNRYSLNYPGFKKVKFRMMLRSLALIGKLLGKIKLNYIFPCEEKAKNA